MGTALAAAAFGMSVGAVVKNVNDGHAQPIHAATPAVAFKPLPTGPKAISVEDFLVDKPKGDVAVQGLATCLTADYCSLSGDNVMQAVAFNTGQLSHDDRKRLLGCNAFLKNCPATVTIDVEGEGLATTYKAVSIWWAPTEEDIAANDPTLPACDTVSEGDLKEMAEGSGLGALFHLHVSNVTIQTTVPADGHPRCVAKMDASSGEKTFHYHLDPASEMEIVQAVELLS